MIGVVPELRGRQLQVLFHTAKEHGARHLWCTAAKAVDDLARRHLAFSQRLEGDDQAGVGEPTVATADAGHILHGRIGQDPAAVALDARLHDLEGETVIPPDEGADHARVLLGQIRAWQVGKQPDTGGDQSHQGHDPVPGVAQHPGQRVLIGGLQMMEIAGMKPEQASMPWDTGHVGVIPLGHRSIPRRPLPCIVDHIRHVPRQGGGLCSTLFSCLLPPFPRQNMRAQRGRQADGHDQRDDDGRRQREREFAEQPLDDPAHE